MAKCEWLYCNDEWTDIVNIIKLEKNPAERVREFRDIIKREELTVGDVYSTWGLFEREEIESYAKGWFYDYDLEDAATLGHDGVTYWFFNIFTGEAMYFRYFVQITYSGIVTV